VPIAVTDSGLARGLVDGGANEFLGLPYAAPPTGRLRWRPPQPPAAWHGVRNATEFASSCPQSPSLFVPPGPQSEDCLYLNVYAPARTSLRRSRHPVVVWIHGGGFTQDGARNYDPTQMAADGTVVITLNYRLGALGFLAHPALASHPGGAAGNYGLMDQQAALRWVQRNVAAFGGDPRNVTVAGQSAGGVSVLMQLISPGSRGLFQKAIVESGAFALTQQPLAAAESFGQTFAAQVGCPDQTAACLRSVPVDHLLAKFPGAAIPGIVDGDVLRESVGTALAAGRFAHVPILNGNNHDEELIFVLGTSSVVSGGTFVPITLPVTPANYQQQIETSLNVSASRAAQIANVYPASAYPDPAFGLSALVGDANFACSAYQVDAWTARRSPTFAYEFDDDTAPPRYAPIPVATHSSEIQYLFDLPNTPIPGGLNPQQQLLSNAMRGAWESFAAHGNPATTSSYWPSFIPGAHGVQLVLPQPQLDTSFATRHHCSLWAQG
jgi:para-nitrobenzyl esterase